MLNNKKRMKLLAGVLAAVMLTTTAGCGNDEEKDEEWENGNAQESQHSNGFFPWFFLGRMTNWGSGGGSFFGNSAPNSAPKSAVGGDKSGSTVQQQNSNPTERTSKFGNVGSSGKSGIGSGMSRSHGSAVS